MEPKERRTGWPVRVGIGVILIVAYGCAYWATACPAQMGCVVWEGDEPGEIFCVYVFNGMELPLQTFFWPAHEIDKQIRVECWHFILPADDEDAAD